MPGNNGVHYTPHSTALNDDRVRSDPEFATKLEKRREQSRIRTRRWRERHPDRVEQWNTDRRRIYREDPEQSARLHSTIWAAGTLPYGWGLNRSAIVQGRREVQALREMVANMARHNEWCTELERSRRAEEAES